MCAIRACLGKTRQDEKKYFMQLQQRGPDYTERLDLDGTIQLGFHRLAIRDTTHAGDQPFYLETQEKKLWRVCNGELYGYEHLKEKYTEVLKSHSDCEIIGHVYLEYGKEKLCSMLDGEFAFLLIEEDKHTGILSFMAARDPFGVRPLFVGYDDEMGYMYFSSQMKGLDPRLRIEPFSPGTYMTGMKIGKRRTHESIRWFYYDYTLCSSRGGHEKILHDEIEATFITSIQKRLISDRHIGSLLSGGLDSSLVCGVVARLLGSTPLHTFTIGMEGGTDLSPARDVADYIGSVHHEFLITPQDALAAIDDVIYTIESRDTTTIRASVFQYLIGKYISQETDIKVLLTGEGSDELTGGYMYFHQAPDIQTFHDECVRLLQDIYLYDGLRVDRSMARRGLEVRIPFLDPSFVSTYLSVDPGMRKPQDGHEKYLLRKSFSEKGYIPEEVIWRKKEAFSDGVSTLGDSWFAMIARWVETKVTDQQLADAHVLRPICTPKTKEQVRYRMRFDHFFWQQHGGTIPYYRMPKRVKESVDPSARFLEVYDEKDISK